MNTLNLTNAGIADRAPWEAAGYTLPAYDRAAMIAATAASPAWVHFGAGNIFRAFQCNLAERLLADGVISTGIIACEGYDYEIVQKGYRPQDNLCVLVTLKADGQIEKKVIGAVAESCVLDSENEAEFARLREIFACPGLQLASFTITEKGYATRGADGQLAPAVAADLAQGPDRPASYLGKVVSLLYTRYQRGACPIAMVSMDNCSHNGDRLREAVLVFARGWAERGCVEPGFCDWVSDPARVSFPWSMIDKITPRPDASVERLLAEDGPSLQPVITAKKTYIAPFVNAEESEYLVVEDCFPNGRPPLERAGVIFTDRDTVNRVERMKVCTCLNPLHTALAIFGCLLGYDRISEEMKDPQLRELVCGIGYREGLPVVTDPGVINPRDFIDTVINVRIPNPFMPDTPQRIATDTSQKLPIRFGETIKAYLASDTLRVDSLRLIPLVFAGWLRYLMAVDDAGRAFEPSADPLLGRAQAAVAGFRLGQVPGRDEALSALRPLLGDAEIFGVDLFRAGLADRVTDDFLRMLEGPGAVRAALCAALAG